METSHGTCEKTTTRWVKTMIDVKQKLFHQYYELTLRALQSLEGENVEEVNDWLQKREEIARQVDEIDQTSHSVLKNDTIRDIIRSIQEADKQLIQLLHQRKSEAEVKLKEIRKAKQLQRMYNDDQVYTEEGVFYDKRK